MKSLKSRAWVGVWLGLSSGFTACQLSERNGATVIFQPAPQPASLSPVASAIPADLLSVIREASIEKVYNDDGDWTLKLSLEVARKVRQKELLIQGVFESAPESEEEGWVGEEIPAQSLDESDPELSGLRVSFQCLSDSCDSVLAHVISVKSDEFSGSATIEHRVLDDLQVRASRKGQIESPDMKQAVQWLQESDIALSGRVIVDQVHGSEIRTVRAWAQILPASTHSVFKGSQIREGEDLTQRMEYFVRKVGVRTQRHLKDQSKVGTGGEELFFSNYSPKAGTPSAGLSKGKWVRGEVEMDLDSKTGKLRVTLSTQSLSDSNAGVLILTFQGEKLLGSPL